MMSRCTHRCFPSMCVFTSSIIPIVYCRDLLFCSDASAWSPTKTGGITSACSRHSRMQSQTRLIPLGARQRRKHKTNIETMKCTLMHCSMQHLGKMPPSKDYNLAVLVISLKADVLLCQCFAFHIYRYHIHYHIGLNVLCACVRVCPCVQLL